MLDLFQYEFMRNALLASILVSLACGIIGTLVVLNRIVFISGGIAHAAYGGVGLAYFLGLDPIVGAVGFSLISALAMGWVHRRQHQRSDTTIGVIWAMGMAIGIIFISLSPGYKADLMSYLFGSILAVSQVDLVLMLVVTLLVIMLVVIFFRLFLSISFDETFAAVRNVPVTAVYLLMVILIALTVVISMRVVGLIMVIALMTIPAAIANIFIKQMGGIMLLAAGLSIAFTVSGLLVSYWLNLPSGATIIMVMGAGYLLALLSKSIWMNRALTTRDPAR